MGYWSNNDVNEMLGQTLVEIKGLSEGNDLVYFKTLEGNTYKMYHSQGCCESVSITDIEGNLEDLLNNPLTQAEEVTNADGPEPEYAESYTWTFYKFATVKGYVTVRWLGESNGYYSESVDFEQINN